jgi:hypothetical protein
MTDRDRLERGDTVFINEPGSTRSQLTGLVCQVQNGEVLVKDSLGDDWTWGAWILRRFLTKQEATQ